MKNNKIKNLKIMTSESVGIGHPDKICDQISDAVLYECLKSDPNSRVACEVLASDHLIVIGGEITTKTYVDVVSVAWSVLLPLGYKENDFTILSNINKQSPDINNIVDKTSSFIGAGDQGMVFGYATNESKEYLPLPYILASKIVAKINELTKKNILIKTKYDTKSQVSMSYDDNDKPVGIDNIVVAIQHDDKTNLTKMKNDIKKLVLIPLAKEYKLNTDFVTHINEKGKFVIGGPFGDTGLTGRKLMVDTYGSLARHGGGAFSGKDYTKVDRTGAYFARYIAKNIVAAKLATKVEVQLSYCIGFSKPLSMSIECFGTNKTPLPNLYKAINKSFDFELSNVVKQFNLYKFNYKKISVYGHFTSINTTPPWEKIDKVKKLSLYSK